MNLSILYRGPLSSCNYACGYCPFAKRTETRRRAGPRPGVPGRGSSSGSAAVTADTIGVLFTPWGEALVRALVPGCARGAHAAAARARRWRSRRTSRAGSTGSKRATGPSSRSGAPTTRPRRPASGSWQSAASCIGRGVRFSVGVVG